MSLILAIETATSVCSVALAQGENLLSIREASSPNVHSSMITVLIEELFLEAGFNYTDLDAVALSIGPGSYTGLRIGAAVAKGLCYGLDKPLIAIPTLQAMAAGMSGSRQKIQSSSYPASSIQDLVCPMIDARRMEVYCAVYDEHLEEILDTDARIIDENSFQELLANHILYFAGDGADKCKSILDTHPHARFINDFHASAKHMISLAEQRFQANQFEEVAYVEPYYLKDFVAGKPNVKGLH